MNNDFNKMIDLKEFKIQSKEWKNSQKKYHETLYLIFQVINEFICKKNLKAEMLKEALVTIKII